MSWADLSAGIVSSALPLPTLTTVMLTIAGNAWETTSAVSQELGAVAADAPVPTVAIAAAATSGRAMRSDACADAFCQRTTPAGIDVHDGGARRGGPRAA